MIMYFTLHMPTWNICWNLLSYQWGPSTGYSFYELLIIFIVLWFDLFKCSYIFYTRVQTFSKFFFLTVFVWKLFLKFKHWNPVRLWILNHTWEVCCKIANALCWSWKHFPWIMVFVVWVLLGSEFVTSWFCFVGMAYVCLIVFFFLWSNAWFFLIYISYMLVMELTLINLSTN